MTPLSVVQFGLGPIGIEAVKLAATQPWLRYVGGVDNDPAKAGRTLGDLTGLPALADCPIWSSLDALLAAAKPDVILHTASSSAKLSLTQVRPALERGLAVVSTCEELLFPRLRGGAALVDEFDALCRRTGGRVVAAGVNPGFVMDVLPLCLTAVSREVDSIYVERVVNASTRRQPLQAKIGSGLPPDEFRAKFAAGRAGHAGFQESVALIAHALGWPLDRIVETCEPVVAETHVRTAFFALKPGETRGLHQRALGLANGGARITLDLVMALDEPNPHDTVVIRGRPPLHLTLSGGVAGDDATIAALVNTVPRLLESAPGVRLPTDLPLPRRCGL
jgi:4-hydroxy-tetrahydrodipicolinate reductase